MLNRRLLPVLAALATFLAAVGLAGVAPVPAGAAPANTGVASGGRSPDVFRGYGAWADVYEWSPTWAGPHPSFDAADIDAMATEHVDTLYIQAAKNVSSTDIVDEAYLRTLIDRAHGRGIKVVAWYLPALNDLTRDFNRIDAVATLPVDGLGIDIEATYVSDVTDRNNRLLQFTRTLRARHPNTPIAAIPYPPVQLESVNPTLWNPFPWAQLDPYYDAWMPMAYWEYRTTSSGWRDAYRYIHENVVRVRADTGNPNAAVHPIGSPTSAADVTDMLRAIRETQAIGGSVYAWPITPTSVWPALRPLHDTTPPYSLGVASPASPQAPGPVSLSWLGADDGLGISWVTFEVSTDGSPYVPWELWLPTVRSDQIAGGSVVLDTAPRHTYEVRIRGADQAGNVTGWSAPAVFTTSGGSVPGPFTAAYSVGRDGTLGAVGSAPVALADPSPGGRPAAGIVLNADGGGWVVGARGALESFGTTVNGTSANRFPFDIARGIALNPDGTSGYILDGFGGLNAFGGASFVDPAPYWPGWDIARGIALLPTSTAARPAGYILDAFGGVHPFGAAPPIGVTGYRAGSDHARSIALNPDGSSGYVLDFDGSLHPLGGATPLAGVDWGNWDIARSVVLLKSSTRASPAGLLLDGFGGVHPLGSAAQPAVQRYWGYDNAVALGLAR